MNSLLANLQFYVPEAIVVMTMCSLLFMEAFYRRNEKNRTMVFITAGIGLFLALIYLISSLSDKTHILFSNAIVIDPYSTFVKIVLVLGTLGVIYLGHFSQDIYKTLKSEFVILVVGVLVGGMLLASANNLLTFYLGIETLSILSYVLTSLKKEDGKSSEAGLKYALYGGIAAGVMLFGMSHIYGIIGSIQFLEIAQVIKHTALQSSDKIILMISFILFFAGIGFKIAAFPFHMWSPDVYQGAPIPVTAFFAIVPKLAGLAALLRVTMTFFGNGDLTYGWIGLLQIIAALTMTVGNVSALNQSSMKRLLAFSSIGHAGMMLMGIVVLNELGAKAILFYGVSYLFMTLVAFFITSFVSDKYGDDGQDHFSGMIYRYPYMSICLIITLFSLAGLPPFAGFVAKYNIFAAVIEKQYYGLALIAAMNSVISLYYYMKVVKVMVFGEAMAEEKIEGFGFSNQLIIVGLTVPVLVLGIFWEKIMLAAGHALMYIH